MAEGTFTSFADMLREALGDLLAPGASSYVEMFDENGVMEFPYAPPGGVTRIEGRPALVEYLSHLGEMLDLVSMTKPVVHRTTDASVVILELNGTARSLATEGLYQQRYISVIRVANGHIVHYRDYWNPLVVQQMIHDASLVAPQAESAANVR